MKKTILRTILFGALLMSPMFVVSCSDDYDDSELKTMISDTQTDVTSLQTKLTALTAAQEALPTAADIETAKNAAIAAAKAESDGSIDSAVEDAIEQAFDADAAQLLVVQGLIADLKAEIEAADDDIEIEIGELDTRIDEIVDSISDLMTMIGDNSTAIGDNSTAIETNNNLILDLQNSLADAMSQLTGVTKILTNMSIANSVGDLRIIIAEMEVVNGDDFGEFDYPYETGNVFDSVKTIRGNNLMVVANPSTIDMDAYEFVLRNSKEVLPGVKLIPSVYEGLLTRAADANNILSFEPVIDTTLLHAYMRENYSPTFHNVRFAVQATDMDGRSVTSNYSYVLDNDVIGYSPATSVVRYSESDTTNTYTPDMTAFGTDYFQGTLPAANVYKQYITLDDIQPNVAAADAADFTGLDEVIDGNKSIKISCTNKYAYNHQAVAFTVHYLYPDGSRTEISTDFTFGEMEFADVTLNLNAYVNLSMPATAQSSDTIALTDLMNSVGSLSTWMAKAKKVKVEVNADAPKPMNFTGTSFNSYDASAVPTTVTMTPPTNMVPFTDSLRTLFITFDANEITETGVYGSTFTFYDNDNNVVNVVYVNMNVMGVDSYTLPYSKVTASWNTALNVNNVWLNTDMQDGGDAVYSMNTSYNNLPASGLTFTDPSTSPVLAFSTYDLRIANATSSTIGTMPDTDFDCTSSYIPAGFTTTAWAITDDFTIHFRSPIAEAQPRTVWDATTKSLIYQQGGVLTLGAADITALDPSNINNTINYLGTINPNGSAYAAAERDYRISSIVFSITDDNEVVGVQSNTGLVNLTVNANSISIEAAPLSGTNYPSLTGTPLPLNLVMTVTDVFGFVTEYTLPFEVINPQVQQ